MKLYFIDNIIRYGKRRKKIEYPMANPSIEDYRKAKNYLEDFESSSNIPRNEYVDIIAYFIKYPYMYTNSANTSNPDKIAEFISRKLATAPWIAQYDNNYYKKHLIKLMKANKLIYKSDGFFLNPEYYSRIAREQWSFSVKKPVKDSAVEKKTVKKTKVQLLIKLEAIFGKIKTQMRILH